MRKGPDLPRPFRAQLRQLHRPVPIDRFETVETAVETAGLEPAPDVW